MSKRKSSERLSCQPAKVQLITRDDSQSIEIEDDPSLPVELSLFEQLPEHVLENIFSNVSNKDILTMTLTSKHLNLLIGNNSKILQKIQMVFPKIGKLQEGAYLFENVRKYSNWIFKHGILMQDLPIAFNFLEPYGNFVKQITFEHSTVKAPTIRLHKHMWKSFSIVPFNKTLLINVLAICNKIESLTVTGSLNITAQDIKSIRPLSLPKLRRLAIKGNSFTNISCIALLRMFQNCTLEYFHFGSSWMLTSYPRQTEIHSHFANFLLNQQKIEHLSLSNAPAFLDTVGEGILKLKKLSLNNGHGIFWTLGEKFHDFIYDQMDTLEHLELHNNFCCNEFGNDFTLIKKLTLYNCDLIKFETPMPFVETLTTIEHSSRKNIRDFSQIFPNLKELNLENSDVMSDILLKLHAIERVSLNRCVLKKRQSFYKLKLLKMEYCKSDFESALNWKENKLEQLIINQGSHEWIEDFIKCKDTKLILLKLIGKKYTEKYHYSLHQTIQMNRKKIRDLIVNTHTTR